jgi:SPX domain protein involved in polyphosphate accumulation
MSFRIEKKYEFNLVKLENFYQFLNKNYSTELYPGRIIKSIYFDNYFFSSYHDSVEGTVPRKKIRIRNYPNTNDRFNLEIKINSIEGRYKTVKNNINSQNILNKGYFDHNYGICVPVVEISYFRKYFSVFNLRVTLDTSICFKKYNEKKTIPSLENAIIEVKSNSLNDFNYIDNKFHFQTTRFSKYCNAIEELGISC